MLYFFLCVFVHVVAVNISMDILKSSSSYSIQINLTCNTIYDNARSQNVLAELRTSSKLLYDVTGSCSEEVLVFNSLLPTEEYTVELKWRLANGHMCTVEKPILLPVLSKAITSWSSIMLMIVAFLVVLLLKITHIYSEALY